MDIHLLLQANDYHQFVRIFVEEKSKISKHFSYAEIARKAGFSSRSFVRDVAFGKKRLTVLSLQKYTRGLGLTSTLKDYFMCLVACKEQEVASTFGYTPEQLNHLKRKLLAKTTQKSFREDSENTFSLVHAPLVYAALGKEDVGASAEEILNRISLPNALIKETLDGLIRAGFVHLDVSSNTYKGIATHVDFANLGSLAFKRFFNEATERAKKASNLRFTSEEELFFSSSFSVNASDLQSLKKNLRKLLSDFIQKSEVSEGNTVISLVTGFHR